MTRTDAAVHLRDLLALDLVGDLLDAIGDEDVRDLVLKLVQRLKTIEVPLR